MSLDKLKYIFGIILLVCGSIIVLITFVWLAAYFIERTSDLASLWQAVSREFLYWAPVILLGIPGVMMLYHGRRLLKNEKVSVISLGEIMSLFAIAGIIAALVFPIDNFSFIAASIIVNSKETVKPLQEQIENYHAGHGHFPGSNQIADGQLPQITLTDYTRSVTTGDAGRIIITFDTQDIDWGWSWWHGLLFIESNDLTGKTLVLVPVVKDDAIVWDECNEGTAPQRNRHFKCSGHM